MICAVVVSHVLEMFCEELGYRLAEATGRFHLAAWAWASLEGS